MTEDAALPADSADLSQPAEPPDARTHRLLHGRLRPAVLFLALPVLAEQLLNSMVGFVDTWLSGRLGASATSAIGLGAYVNWLAEICYALVGTGTTAIVARHWGAGEFDNARRAASCSVMMSFAFGLAGIGMIYSLAPVFGDILGIEPDSHAKSVRYLRISCFGQFFTSILLIGAAALRASGNMWMPMRILGLVSLLNVVFSSVLVLGVKYPDSPLLALGVDGIAIGTILAKAIGAVLMLFLLTRSRDGLHVVLNRSTARDAESARRVMKIGRPAALDGIFVWAGHFAFLKIISGLGTGRYGEAIFSAHIVGVIIEAINYLPAWAWGTAAATLMGQSLGAGKTDRAHRGGREAVLQAGIVALATMIGFYLGAAAIYEFMHEDPLVQKVGTPALRILALFELPLSMAIVYLTGIRGAGTTIPPMIINFSGIYLIRLPLAWYLGVHLGFELNGAWMAMGIDVTVRAIVLVIYFERGSWKRRLV